MELTKVYFFVLTVLTNFSLEIFAQDTLSDYTSSTTDNSDSDNSTLEPSTTAGLPAIATTIYTQIPHVPTTARAYSSAYQDTFEHYSSLDNVTQYDKSLLRTTESTWEPVDPSLRFGLPTNMRRGRPKCCRRVRENEKKELRKMNCKNGSLFFRDARGRKRRKCRRRNRCKQRCKQHYSNTAWNIVGTMMKGLDFFIPKLEFKFHTGTLVFGTKFFSGLVPFIQAKIQAMHFFYSLFEPLLDGVLDVLDFGRIGFRSLSLDDDDDDEDEEETANKHKVEVPAQDAVIVDEKYDAEKVEDYDDSDILPDLMLAKKTLPDDNDDDDEGYDSPKDEPVDEDYGIDEDWDGDDDDEDDDEETFNDSQEDNDEAELHKRITLPKPPKIIKRPISLRPRPTRKTILPALITPPNELDDVHSDSQTLHDFMNRIKDDDLNFTVYHSNLVGSSNFKQANNGHPGAANKLPFNDTHVLNVDNLVLNINAKPKPEELYEDEVEYQDSDLDDDKLIEEAPSAPVKKTKSRPPIFSSFGAFFAGISEAFDSYFSGTY